MMMMMMMHLQDMQYDSCFHHQLSLSYDLYSQYNTNFVSITFTSLAIPTVFPPSTCMHSTTPTQSQSLLHTHHSHCIPTYQL
jgi:hypothetical protein